MQVGITSTTSGFLTCLGLPASDPQLPLLCTKYSGSTVLHCVARHLWDLADLDFPEQTVNDWVRLGVAVLNNGADPSSIAKRQISSGQVYRETINPWPEWETTPLLDCMNVWNWGIIVGDGRSLRSILKSIRIWACIVQQAGIDLCQYGAQEREVWTTIPKAQSSYPPADWTVSELIYGSTPEQWSLKVQSAVNEKCRVFELGPLPGSFPSERKYLPATIIWKPTSKEEIEGIWTEKESLRVRVQPVDLRELIPTMEYKVPFAEYVKRFQDDTGPVCMMQYRVTRERPIRQRSHSQPPPACVRAHVRYKLARRDTFDRPSWLPPYHNCPYDSKWGFRCRRYIQPSDSLWFPFSRSCVKGIFDGSFSVQEAWPWKWYSFLAEISECQDGFQSHVDRGILHTGTEDCPWNCKAVDLEKLDVPEELKLNHPTRQSRRYEKYRVR